jgi:hypothetical protein
LRLERDTVDASATDKCCGSGGHRDMLDVPKARRTPWKKGVPKPTGGKRATDAAARIVAGPRTGQDRLAKSDEAAGIDGVGSGGAVLIVGKGLNSSTRAEARFSLHWVRRV